MAIQPIVRQAISNVNYIQSKTKADKFIEKISGLPENNSEKPVNTYSLRTNDKFINSEDDDNIAINKSSVHDTNSLNFPVSSKTTAHKFVQQLSTVSNDNNDTKFGFVDIGSTEQKSTSVKPNELRKISLKPLDKTNFQNKVLENIEQLPIKPSLKNLLLAYFEINKNNIVVTDKKTEDLVNEVVSGFINDVVNDLIAKIELSESLLDFTITPTLNLELGFIVKLREIISDLDQSLRELQKQTEARKKDSKVEIKIKRFNPKELINN